MKRYLLFLICILSSVVVFSCTENTTDTPDSSADPVLKEYKKNFLIGARPDPTFQFNGTNQNAQVLKREFNTIQPTCYGFIAWKDAYRYDFDAFNNWVNWGIANNQKVIMHMIAGPNQYFSDWIKKPRIAWNVDEFDNMLEAYIKSMMTSNDNNRKVYAWNVANEVFNYNNEGGYQPDSDCFLHLMGWEDDMSGLTGEDKINSKHPVYISKAFEYAAKYAGSGLLELRDISFEFNPTGKKAKALYQLILHLRAKGLRVDALGLQCHLYNSNSDSYNYNNFIAVCRKFKALGLELYVAELDIAAFGNMELQKQRYKDFIGVCGRAGIDHVYFWGVADGKDPNWRTTAQPLLFDANYNKKPAYFGVLEALQESEN